MSAATKTFAGRRDIFAQATERRELAGWVTLRIACRNGFRYRTCHNHATRYSLTLALWRSTPGPDFFTTIYNQDGSRA